ncbi:nitroreductase family protein [Natribacillus halophilus]|uniref:Putative NAD(P)H nitroreductase n=1 Tax=Natribacillus halophilus TaxID=549003 RepID=A0A1G8Q3I2_9BACI|nr:nitroreductase [Natribacillus halophilus]SDI99319.1 Nitroreductase [Natribacillus halophilus]
METLEAIRTRRSNGKVHPDQPVDRELIETILEAGTWAPNHHHTEPWIFYVQQGEGRRPLGKTLRKIAAEEMEGEGEAFSEKQEKKLEKTEGKPFRAPVVITIVAEPVDKDKVVDIEEYAATHAAAQNMLLAAHALGLGAIWRSGRPTYHEKMRRLYNVSDRGAVVGFIYLGWPALTKKKESWREPVEDKTTWVYEDRS